MKRPFVHRDRALPAHNIIDAIKILVVPNTYSKCSQFTLLQSTYHSQDSVSCQRASPGPSLLTVIRARGGGGGQCHLVVDIGFVSSFRDNFFQAKFGARDLYLSNMPRGARCCRRVSPLPAF